VQNKQKIGPLSLSQMQQMSHSGKLKPEDMVLQEGARTWVPASKVITQFGDTVSPSQAAHVLPDTVDASRRTVTFTPSNTLSDSLGAPPSATLAPAVPGYEILGELGRGGMGVVYKARHTTLKRLVALKMILAGGHAAASELARFLAEAQAVARLQHPNIVQVHEIGEKDGLPYFSLEYVDGGTLAKRLSGTPLPPRDAAQLTVTLALAIEAAHQAGIVHRDLKPANVLLAGTSPSVVQCVPKIADFGLAKTLDDDSGQTRTGAIMGTPSYMSPEQASGQIKAIGPRTDVYALGAMLYEMLTGRPPFRSATIVETLEQVRSQEPVSPRSLQPSLPRDLETICLKCLAKDPTQRYGTAKELADDLQRFVTNQPVIARPAGLPERTLKFVKRNRLLVGAAMTVFFVLLLGLISTRVEAARANAEAENARTEKDNVLRELREKTLKEAEVAWRAGDMRRRLKVLNDAIKLPNTDYVGLRLDLARTHAALAEADKVNEILDELEKRDDLGKHEGSVLLLRGYTAMGSRTKAGFDYIEKSLTKYLPEEERLFAQGLQARTSPEAVDFLTAALKKDPYHEPSRAMLAMMLFMLGRVEEADATIRESMFRFPDNPNFRVIRMAILARNKKKKEALEMIAPTEKQFTKAQFRVVKALVNFLDAAGRLDDPDGGATPEEVAAMWAQLAPDMHVIWPIAPGQVPKNAEEGTRAMLQMPPVLNRSLGELVSLFSQVVLDFKNDTANTRLDRVLRSHPEGTLYFVHGTLLHARGEFRQAALQFHSAARLPGIAKIHRTSLVMAAMCEALAALDKDYKVVDEEMLKVCVDTIRELMSQGPIRPHESATLMLVLLRAKRYQLARVILEQWEALGLADNPDTIKVRMKIESGTGAHIKALEDADRLLKMDPKNAEAVDIRALSLEEIRKVLKNAGG
jgi:serine/threonine protein kinase/tetratricopeptide (TPR) repeat protein